ncbi:MAG TPA: hypothetical protein PLR57_02425, partial [Clostridia bacterium]|nr:hypothetical protein [Clostridia bacterium]
SSVMKKANVRTGCTNGWINNTETGTLGADESGSEFNPTDTETGNRNGTNERTIDGKGAE